MRSWRKLFVFSSVYLTGNGSLRQCQVDFVFSDIDPPFFIANQQILKLTVSTGCILIFHSLSVVVENGANTSQ